MSYRILIGIASIGLLLCLATSSRADDEKPAKEKPAAKESKETPSKEPAKERPEAVKNAGEKPSKEQPPAEKPSAKKPAAETPSKEKPKPESPEAQKKPTKEPPTEKPEAKKPAKESPETQKKAKLPGKELTTVDAVVKSVNSDKNTVTVTLRTDDGKAEQTFGVGKDARFMVAGNKAATLADVKPEMRVALILTEQKTVAGIKVAEQGGKKDKPKSQSGDGIVQTVDVEKNQITITIQKDGEKAEQSYQVAKDARVFAGGGDGKLGDIKPGSRVGFMLSENGKTITVIKAGPADEKGSAKKKGEN